MSIAVSQALMSQPQQQNGFFGTWIPIGLVITMMGAAVSYGTLYSKVNDLTTNSAQLNQSLQQTREDVSSLRARNEELLRALSDIKSDIAVIRSAQIKNYGR